MKWLWIVGLAGLSWSQPLRLEKAIPLPGVEGRIDHMTVDVAGKRVFVAALGNHSVEVVDTAEGKLLRSLRGVQEPQGLFYWPEKNRLYVADGGGDKVAVFDSSTYTLITNIEFRSDPDNLRFAPQEKALYVGFGSGALGVLNLDVGKRVDETPLGLHPESFQLEKNGPRIFVNIPGGISNLVRNGSVAVVDRRTRTVVAHWELEGVKQNFPMALDETGKRLFVGCRKPARLIVVDTDSGKQVGSAVIAGDSDDLFYDADLKRIYACGGEGSITVLDGATYQQVASIPTSAGARTCLFVPEFKRLFVAVPHRGKQAAELRVFETVR